jgi:hypothetical protein
VQGLVSCAKIRWMDTPQVGVCTCPRARMPRHFSGATSLRASSTHNSILSALISLPLIQLHFPAAL